MGREALAWLRDARPDLDPVAFFTADASESPLGADVDLPVLTSLDMLRSIQVATVVLAIGDNRLRCAVNAELHEACIPTISVIHPTAFIGPGVVVGSGAIIAPGSVLTRDVSIGAHAIVNYRAAIGHDSVVEDFAFVGPGVVLAGDVRIGRSAMLGAGAIVLPGVAIGPSAVIGAGAVAVRDVLEGTTVVGNPARPVQPVRAAEAP
jgi:acetyltransferase EpsM